LIYSKVSSYRKIYSYKPKQANNNPEISNQQTTNTPHVLRKMTINKPKISEWKEIIRIMAEINKFGNLKKTKNQ
jgi:hypothetical protein